MKTIFIVDDNGINLVTAVKALSDQYRLFTLRFASDMFELLKNVVPDFILLDIIMPEMTGFEVMRILKNDARFSGIPVMFLTSKNDSDTEARSTGYPRGLKGMDIPLQGRIMAIIDVYDALISVRPYKNAVTHEKAVEIIKESRGSYFDPEIVDVFLEISDLFKEV